MHSTSLAHAFRWVQPYDGGMIMVAWLLIGHRLIGAPRPEFPDVVRLWCDVHITSRTVLYHVFAADEVR